jgi:regulator of protease activity HflC (stomatin/prohibitin superfamily)
VFALVLGLGFAGCSTITRVDAGHVGVKIRLAGSERGVQDGEVRVGWVFFNPLTEQVVIFPTSVQNFVWTVSPNEGRAVDESITFSSQEGVNVNADIGLSFHVEPSLAPKLYARFRQNDVSVLAHGYVRNVVREAFNEVASKLPVQEIYGAGKSQMLQQVLQRCREVLLGDGFVIDQLTINGALRLPQNVSDAINRAMEATQNAIQSENRVRQVKAEAEQAIAQANGAAEAARRRAEGEADALLIRARSEAKANEIIRLSMSGNVLQYRALERWDGKLPVYSAGDKLPLLTFDTSKLAGGLDDAARDKRLAQLLEEADQVRAKNAPKAAPTEGASPSHAPASPATPATPATQAPR